MDPSNLTPLCDITFVPTDEACPHAWDDASLAAPTASSVVHKQECAYCFNTNEHHEGTFVCMKCFQGMCGRHVGKHHEVSGHSLYMRVKQTYVKAEAPTSVEQLGVEAPPEIETSVVCLDCRQQLIEGVGLTEEVCGGIHAALAPQLQDQIQTHNAAINLVVCKHCEDGAIQQVPEAERKFGPGKTPTSTAQCMGVDCGCSLNNWMCLTCGFVGCPRAEAGGNQHAITHFLMSGHPLVVKLGTVTPLGADVHCYACDEEVKPKQLSQLLRGLGVDQLSAVKSAKSLSEMMVDQSLKHDWNSITESGKGLTPVYGAGYTGLKNFGNTCYMASVLQCLSAIPSFRQRFVDGELAQHQRDCKASDPHTCQGCQMEKLFKGLASAEFSKERERTQDRERLNGVTPRDFKKLMCKRHPDYSTGEQQDAAEFMAWLLTEIERSELHVASSVGAERAAAAAVNPGRALQFVNSLRTQCSACDGCKYQESTLSILQLPIPLKPFMPPLGPDGTPVTMSEEDKDASRPRTTLDECISAWLLPSEMSCRCSHCNNSSVTYSSCNRMRTMPDVLAIHTLRQYVDPATYQARKLDCYIDAPDELDISRARGGEPQSHENVWEVVKVGQSNAGGAAPSSGGNGGRPDPAVEIDEEALAMVLSLDIPFEDAQWALQMTGGKSADRAVDYYYSHMGDAPSSRSAAASAPASAAASQPQQQPQPATSAPSSVPDGKPTYELFGLVSHVGHSAMTGHYVAHIKKDGRWVIFNDEKVAESVDPPKRLAMIYLYRRREE